MKNKLFSFFQILYPYIFFAYFVFSLFATFSVDGFPSLTGTNSFVGTVFKVGIFVVFLGITAFLFFFQKSKIRLEPFVVAFLLLFFGLIPIWFYQEPYPLLAVDGQTRLFFQTNLTTKINGTVSLLRTVFGIFLTLVFVPKIMRKRDFHVLFLLVLLFAYFSIAYAFVFQHRYMMKSDYSSETRSFFANKNSFGILLFAAMLCCVPSMVAGRKLYFLGFAGLILTALLCYCRSTLLIGLILSFGLLIFFGVRHSDKKAGKGILVLTVALVLMGLIFVSLLLATDFFDRFSLLAKLKGYIQQIVATLFSTSETSRTTIWIWTFRYLLTGPRLVFGLGPNLANDALAAVTSVSKTSLGMHSFFHNSFVEMFAQGGAIRFALTCYLAVNGGFLPAFKKGKKPLKGAPFLALALWIPLCCYQFAESIKLFSDRGLDMAIGVFFISFLPSFFLAGGTNPIETTHYDL